MCLNYYCASAGTTSAFHQELSRAQLGTRGNPHEGASGPHEGASGHPAQPVHCSMSSSSSSSPVSSKSSAVMCRLSGLMWMSIVCRPRVRGGVFDVPPSYFFARMMESCALPSSGRRSGSARAAIRTSDASWMYWQTEKV